MNKSHRMRTEIVKIEIKNWSKYQTRKDLKTMRFFRVENSLFDDAKFASLTTTGKVMWVRLLCECSRGVSGVSAREVQGKCEVNINQTARTLRVSPHHIRGAISQFKELQMVTVSNRNESVPRIEKNRREEKRGEESETQKTSPKKTKPIINNTDSHWLHDLWNSKRKKLPKARSPISSSRLKKIKVRVKQFPEKEIWIEAIQRMADSDFCNGLNDRSWVASFDFLLQPDTVDKALEGKYDSRPVMNKKNIEANSQWERIERGEI